jgi:hypothetical protein
VTLVEPPNREFLFSHSADIEEPQQSGGAGSYGHRMVAKVIEGTAGPDEFHDRMTPIFETGDSRYAWLNTTLAVAVGNLSSSGVSCDAPGVL